MNAPVRTCVGCRLTAPAGDLVRFVLEGSRVVPDPGQARPGRGAWLHPSPECLEAAVKRGGFARSFRHAADTSGLGGQVSEWLLPPQSR
ncbi:YlxR family protein [Propionibacteriaceae bacterium G1746]